MHVRRHGVRGRKVSCLYFAAHSFPDVWVLETELKGVRGLRRSTSWAKVIPSRVKVTCKRLAFNRQSAPCKLNTRRARSAVIASALLLRAAPHDSGPMWVASSHWYDFYIRYGSPV